MDVIPFLNSEDFEASRKRVVELLKRGGVAVIPTDTSYGLGGDATRPDVIARIRQIKSRDPRRPMHIIVSDIEMAGRYVSISDPARELLTHFLPGPITFLLPSKGNLPHDLIYDSPFLGIRIPKQQLLLDLVQAYGKPLTATSANISGMPDLYESEIVQAAFTETIAAPDVLLDGGTLAKVMPSTMVSLDEKHHLELIRKGPVPFEQVKEVAARILRKY